MLEGFAVLIGGFFMALIAMCIFARLVDRPGRIQRVTDEAIRQIRRST